MHFFIYYILPFVVVLGTLIFFHELGHFLLAKSFGVKVLKFSLGFGPKLVGKKVGDTEYVVSALPLGGYVKMLGENGQDEDEELSPEDEGRSFSHQHVLKRIAIVGAGPMFNLFLALFIFCGYYLVAGQQIMIPEIGQVRSDSPAARAGLEKGDIVRAIDGKPIEDWMEIKDIVKENEGKALRITVDRSGQPLTLTVVPESAMVENIFGQKVKSPLIGIVAEGKFKFISLTPPEAVAEGFGKTWEVIKMTFVTIVKLFERVIPIKTLGGPIMIGEMTGELAQESFSYLIPFMAVISINLGILNLLPIPILDGGFMFFLFIELLIGRPLSLRKREWAQKVGLVVLITLMFVVMYNDITRVLN